MSEDWLSFADPLSWHTDDRERRKVAIEAQRQRNILAASTASNVAGLRMALAEILAKEHNTKSYGGGCACAGKRSCSGHVTDTTKIARAALGLKELPDRPRVPMPPEPSKKKRARRKPAA